MIANCDQNILDNENWDISGITTRSSAGLSIISLHPSTLNCHGRSVEMSGIHQRVFRLMLSQISPIQRVQRENISSKRIFFIIQLIRILIFFLSSQTKRSRTVQIEWTRVYGWNQANIGALCYGRFRSRLLFTLERRQEQWKSCLVHCFSSLCCSYRVTCSWCDIAWRWWRHPLLSDTAVE